MVYVSICLCHLWFPLSVSYSFKSTGLLSPWKWSEVIVKLLSHVQLFATLWTVAHQAPLSMGFSRQEYWSGLPFPSPGDLPDPGIEPRSPALQADALTSEPPVWDQCNCAVVWAFFGIALLWDWNENWPFPVLWPLLSFPNLLTYWVQQFHSIIFQDLK